MDEELEVSDDTLSRAPGRAFQFLLALRYVGLWRKLTANGLTLGMVAEGNALLDEVKKASLPPAPEPKPTGQSERDAAVKECAALDEEWLTKYVPIAQRVSRTTAAWIFAGLAPQVGQAESLAVVEKLLARFDAIEAGQAPEQVDASVLVKFADSGLTKAERERVAKLTVAARGAETLPETATAPPPAMSEEAVKAILESLHLWWKAASGIARTAGLKKVELIRLGLASRTTKKKKA